MRKLSASIKKEFLLLINDKVGLLLMYLMPLLLVFIITIVQDSTFKLVNENNIEILVVNKDKGSQGDSLIAALSRSGAFSVKVMKKLSKRQIQKSLLDDDNMLAIEIPIDFSNQMNKKAKHLSNQMLTEFGLIDEEKVIKEDAMQEITLYYDPVLQENFRYSVASSLFMYVSALENKLMIDHLYSEMGVEGASSDLQNNYIENRIAIRQVSANSSSNNVIPSSTQHNVPAWSIFAMFFMVISLGGNIVKERLSGSFVRLQTIPTSFSLVLISKMIIYLLVALSQLMVIFILGMLAFPLIGLPALACSTFDSMFNNEVFP